MMLLELHICCYSYLTAAAEKNSEFIINSALKSESPAHTQVSNRFCYKYQAFNCNRPSNFLLILPHVHYSSSSATTNRDEH